MTRTIIAAVAVAFATVLPAAPAQAQRDRVFVASYGSDSNPCTFGSPCKTFQNAVNVVAAGGEVTAIDSAGFGPVTISKSVTITSPDGVEAGIAVASGGIGISISAQPTDTVQLRGLTLDGAGGARVGIYSTSAGHLVITNCVVENFSDTAIYVAPNGGTLSFLIADTLVTNNKNAGILIGNIESETIYGAISRVKANESGDGIVINTAGSTAPTFVAISDCLVTNNNAIGIWLPGDKTSVSVDNSTISANGTGIEADDSVKVILGRSVIAGNTQYGIDNETTLDNNNSTFYTYQNNQINLNGNSNGVKGHPMYDLAYQ